jgi:hypothetical protein
MAQTRIVLGEWMPDQPGIAGALTEAKNVIPMAIGYGPFTSEVDLSDSASQNLITVFSGKFSGTTVLFAAGTTKLFLFDSTDGSLSDVSQLSGGSPISYTDTDLWKFTQFGAVVIAANGKDKLQAWIANSSTNFADLAAAAPTASYVTVVRDFVVAAKEAAYPNRVYWSDINDETDWTPGTTSQSDTQDIADGGDIQGITGGEFGLVFLERAISRMTYIGSPLFFQFDTISRDLGCYEPRSIVQYGQTSYFLSDDGFYACDGQNVIPIGNEKVDRFFFQDANPSLFSQMSSAIDPINSLVLWSYTNTFGGRSLLIYNWQTKRWSRAETSAQFISTAASAGVTLEGLDTYGTMDTLSSSLDSRLWSGGKVLLAGVNGAKIVTYTGAPMEGDIQTGDFEAGPQSLVKLARPQVDGGSAGVAAFSRMRMDAVVQFGAVNAASDENRVSLRSLGRYHRLKIVPTGASWKHVVAIDVDVTPVGAR